MKIPFFYSLRLIFFYGFTQSCHFMIKILNIPRSTLRSLIDGGCGIVGVVGKNIKN